MTRRRFCLGVVGLFVTVSALAAVLLLPSTRLRAQTNETLIIDQVSVTSDQQFVRLFNGSDAVLQLADYELVYLNADSKPTKIFTFAGEVAPQGFFVLSDTQLTLCYQASIQSVNLGLGTTGGSLELWQYDQARQSKQLASSVTWVKSPKSTTPPTAIKLPEGSDQFLMQYEGEWHYAQRDSEACGFVLASVDPTNQPEEPEVKYEYLPSTLPPVRYAAAAATSREGNRNQGKMAPVVNELLPNPASPQTDAEDEFIELYNPNESSFDLSGFRLAFGSTNPRTYTFPEGTVMKPKEFKTFTSGATSVSLSNTKAQVWLLDPSEKVVSKSEPYQKAKDGQAWALNNGKWVWTLSPTPGKMNTMSAAVTATGSTKTFAAVLGIEDSAHASSSPAATAATTGELADKTPLHPAVLVGVGLAAVTYAGYEYRHDLSNRLFQLKRYFRRRRTLRQEVPGR